MKNLMVKLSGLMASFAFMVALSGANAACIWIIHQPEMPSAVSKLRKF